jgi:hypothetical protein
MSRSGYSDDVDDQWQWIMWRGRVNSAIKGKRGQQFLRDLLKALDDLPEKRLIAEKLEADGEVCAIGSLGRARGVDMSALDPEDSSTVADVFNIAGCLAQEVVYENDEGHYGNETPEARYTRMRAWVLRNIKSEVPHP